MIVSLKQVRLRAGWILAPVFFLLADPTRYRLIAGAAVAVLGAMLRAWAAGTIRKNSELATTGPYAHCRNPLYFGTFMVGIGLVLASGSLLFFLTFLGFFAFVYGKTMRAEEAYLERVFGDAFRRYAAEVPLFAPRLRPYRHGDVTGSGAELEDTRGGSAAGGRGVPLSPGTAPGGPIAGASFDFQRYLANREWELGMGVVGAFAILVLKLVF